jgi:GNAT superfamily N-acetyltransferase
MSFRIVTRRSRWNSCAPPLSTAMASSGFATTWWRSARGAVIAVAAMWDARANLRFTVAAARQILGFYRTAAPAVILRGLRMERVVKPAAAGVAYIGHVAVAPALRGQGAGRALLGHLLGRARHEGHARGALDVAATNPRAAVGLRLQHAAVRRRTGQGGVVRSAEPVPAPRRPDSQSGQYGQGLRRTGEGDPDRA